MRAAQPDEKARSSRKTSANPPIVLVPRLRCQLEWRALGAGQRPGELAVEPDERHAEDRHHEEVDGIANAAPDSRTPRRFIAVSSPTITTATTASCPRTNSKAEAAFWTPEDTDTATVST